MTTPAPILLAIESSCDDTSVAVLQGFRVLANVVHSQVLHERFGGVVPELASRAHVEALMPTWAMQTSKALR
jgi:N6-L-threonylcarbamoyladenine synthase